MKKSIAMGCLIFTAGAFHVFVSFNSMAQSDILTQMDLDEDGMISIREAVADPVLLASFGKIDTDGDGKISAQELAESQIMANKEKQA
ncbi:hypothetical protein [Aliiglaciecola litoralis]|uniref:EF-hand domain-containing protein n=1 Tax=Aliiglaciecola litoralis TaxID=582857 RepID=A0ABP3WNE2_9ALTE